MATLARAVLLVSGSVDRSRNRWLPAPGSHIPSTNPEEIMNRLVRVKEARLRAALDAAVEWQAREEERADTQAALVSGGPAAAESADRQAAFRRRESARIAASIENAAGLVPQFFEGMVGGTLDWASRPPNDTARAAGRPVARIVDILASGEAEPFGSGFLVAPGLLLTNHHVLRDSDDAEHVCANFLHEETRRGVREGPLFELDPGAFFVTDEELDFTLIGVKPQGTNGEPLDDLGVLSLIEAQGKILKGHPISIIQYPAGGTKKYATMQNLLVDLSKNMLYYTTDTLRSSSGSPGFNVHWEVVGLHRMGVPLIVGNKVINTRGQPWDRNTMTEDEIHWVANQGVRVSAIVGRLRALQPDSPGMAAQLQKLLATTVDPLGLEGGRPATTTSRPRTGPAVGTAPAPQPPVQINIAGNATIYVGPEGVTAQPNGSSTPARPATEASAPAGPVPEYRAALLSDGR